MDMLVGFLIGLIAGIILMYVVLASPAQFYEQHLLQWPPDDEPVDEDGFGQPFDWADEIEDLRRP